MVDSILTLSATALQSYVIRHTRVRQKFHFSKMIFLPRLTIVLRRIYNQRKFAFFSQRVCYNLTLIVPCVTIVLLASLPRSAAIFQYHCFYVPPLTGIKYHTVTDSHYIHSNPTATLVLQ